MKWFSNEKGYGYIVADDGRDHYFNVRDVLGSDLTRNGDAVRFTSNIGPKGPRASSVTIVPKVNLDTTKHLGRHHSNDDRVTCTHCGKKMIPRLVTYRGRPTKSLCPFCGETFKDFGWCFIATAVYGDYDAPQVIALRRFRDANLMSTQLGRAFVASYYKVSPPIATLIAKRTWIAKILRPFFNQLAKLVR